MTVKRGRISSEQTFETIKGRSFQMCQGLCGYVYILMAKDLCGFYICSVLQVRIVLFLEMVLTSKKNW